MPANDRARRAAWLDLLFVDFGILRLFWKNRARLGEKAWRSNQPTPFDIAWAHDQGIRTIVSGRHDPRHGGHALELESCARFGLAFHTLPIFSREAPSRAAILEAAAYFAKIEGPILIHCKSGADRAGFLAALYAIVVENQPVRAAAKQLSWRFLHFKQSRTGILDAVFAAYLAQHPDEAVPFLAWVAQDYDAAALNARFRHGRIADFIERIVLRRE